MADKKSYPFYREVLAEGKSAFWGDLYALTMAQSLFTLGIHNTMASFELYIRKTPFGGKYLVSAGQGIIAEWLNKHWKFDEVDIYRMNNEYVIDPSTGKEVRLFTQAFTDFCEKATMQLNIDALQEGDLAFPDEPIMRVLGPIWLGLMVETGSLNAVNSQSLFATLASRLAEATGSSGTIMSPGAEAKLIFEFGLRRSQDIGGLAPARGAYIGGTHKTSNMLAWKHYDIPVTGTFAHALVMMAEDEITAFRGNAKAMPHGGIFLVDTYDTIQGVKNAIAVCKEAGIKLKGIRLDSGDLATLSIEARKLMDAAGFTDAKIAASNDLDEAEIVRLQSAGARIDIWAVGTNLVTSKAQPALGAVYKLTGIFGDKVSKEMMDLYYKARQSGDTSPEALMKFRDQIVEKGQAFYRDVIKYGEKPRPGEFDKASTPGHKQILRFVSPEGKLDGDVLYPADAKLPYVFAKAAGCDAVLTRDLVAVDKNDPSKTRTYKAGTPLLLPQKPMFDQDYKYVWETERIQAARARREQKMSQLPHRHRKLIQPEAYDVKLDTDLAARRRAMIQKQRSGASPGP